MIPIYLLRLITNKYLFILIILLNGLIRVIFVINEIELKGIIAYSSINHLCWILVRLNFNKSLWLFYFLIYILILIFLIFIFNYFNIIYIIDIFINRDRLLISYIIIIGIFRLGGIPSITGFIIKWNFILQILNYNIIFLLILIFFSLLFLYNYIRIIFIYIFDYTLNLKKFYNVTLNFHLFFIYLVLFLIFGLFLFIRRFIILI